MPLSPSDVPGKAGHWWPQLGMALGLCYATGNPPFLEPAPYSWGAWSSPRSLLGVQQSPGPWRQRPGRALFCPSRPAELCTPWRGTLAGVFVGGFLEATTAGAVHGRLGLDALGLVPAHGHIGVAAVHLGICIGDKGPSSSSGRGNGSKDCINCRSAPEPAPSPPGWHLWANVGPQ